MSLWGDTEAGKGGRWCWPGSSYYFDALSPDARSWWADQFALTKWKGSTTNLYLWNDMNEPSVFSGPEVSALLAPPHADLIAWVCTRACAHARRACLHLVAHLT